MGYVREAGQCPGVQLGCPVPAANKYRNMAHQVGGVSNLRIMVMSPAGIGPQKDCAGEAQQWL
jgi:hypothetical protein